MTAKNSCIDSLRLLVLMLVLSASSKCASTVSFDECRDDSDCMKHPAWSSAIALHCTHDHLCVQGTPLASLCAETYPPSSPADAILIGALVNRDYGNDALLLKAYQLAIDEINTKRSRPNDAPLALRICEINTDKEDPLKSMRVLTRTPHLVAVVGPSTSRDVIAVKDEVIRAGVPILSAGATAPEISFLGEKDGTVTNGLFYRVVPSDIKQGPVLAAIALKKAADLMIEPNFSLIYADDQYGRGLKAAVVARIEQLGRSVRPTLAYAEPVGGPDIGAIDRMVDSLLSGNQATDLIAIPNRHSVALLQSIASHPNSNQIRQIIMGEGGKNESVLQLLSSPNHKVKNLLDRISGSAPTVDIMHPSYRKFEADFLRVSGFNANSTVFTAFAYDAVYALSLAIGAAAEEINPRKVQVMLSRLNGCLTAPTMKKHASVGEGRYADSRRIIENQNSGIVLDGLTGEICFTPHGDRVDGSYEQWWVNSATRQFEQSLAIP